MSYRNSPKNSPEFEIKLLFIIKIIMTAAAIYNIDWHGSYLGEFPIDIIKAETRTAIGCYWKLELSEDQSFYCLVKKFKTTFNIIFDEFKESCRLTRLGTQITKIGNTLYLVIKVMTQTITFELNGKTVSINVVREDIPLSKFPPEYIDNTLYQTIGKIFAFRYIMAISQTWESHIYIRKAEKSNGYYAISFMESSVNFSSKREKLPATVYAKWFLRLKRIMNVDINTVDTLSNSVKSLLGLPQRRATTNQKISAIATFRTKLENIINRVDKEQIWMPSFAVQNIISKIY